MTFTAVNVATIVTAIHIKDIIGTPMSTDTVRRDKLIKFSRLDYSMCMLTLLTSEGVHFI